MKLSEHFTLEEFTFSETASRFGINNEPSPTELENLKLLCTNCLEPLRYCLREEKGQIIHIIISSGFRNKKVNSLIGGQINSQHILGMAADIKAIQVPVPELFGLVKKYIAKNKFGVDQCILEFNRWVHISWKAEKRRNQFLIATKENGRTIYS